MPILIKKVMLPEPSLQEQYDALSKNYRRLKAIFDEATSIQGDDEVIKYVTSGNACPVTRCTVSADLIRQLLDRGKK